MRTSPSSFVDARCRVPAGVLAARVRFESLDANGRWRADTTSGSSGVFTSLGRLGARRRVVASWRAPGGGLELVVRSFVVPEVAPSPRILDLGELTVPEHATRRQVRLVPSDVRGFDAERARVLHRSKIHVELEGPLEAPTIERVCHRLVLGGRPLERVSGLADGSYRVTIDRASAHDADAPRWIVAAPRGDDAIVEARGSAVDVPVAVVPGARVELVGASSSARVRDVRATSLGSGARRLSPTNTGPDLAGTIAVDLPEGEWEIECTFEAVESGKAPRTARARVFVESGRRGRAALAWDTRGPRARSSASRRALVVTAGVALGVLALVFVQAIVPSWERGRVVSVPIAVHLPAGTARDEVPRWVRVLAVDRVGGRVRVLLDGRVDGPVALDAELSRGTWEVVAFAGRSFAEDSVRSASRRTWVAGTRFHVTSDAVPVQRLVLESAALAVVDDGDLFTIEGWPLEVAALWPRSRVLDEHALVQPLVPNLAYVSPGDTQRHEAGPGRSVARFTRAGR